MASIMAALKALPAIRDILAQLGSSIDRLADARIEHETQKRLAVVRTELEAIKNTENRDEMLERIHTLNTAISK